MTNARNDPCHCGSGTKYKKCCLPKEAARRASQRERGTSQVRRLSRLEEQHPEIVAMRELIEQQNHQALATLRTEFGVWINFVAPTEYRGKRVWALGSRVYLDQPPQQTFHEFLLHVLQATLGEGWRAKQAARERSHFVLRCFDEYYAWTAAHAKLNPPVDGVWAAEPNGWAQYLRSLAWDIATLIHSCRGGLSQQIVDRLRDPTAYQGVRYEIAVAAIFARLDCEIEFLDGDPALKGVKHVEFIATHRPTGDKIAVEAKSRHRAGVINEGGLFVEQDPLRGDSRSMRRLFVKALEKDVEGAPYIIFLDANAPAVPAHQGPNRQWGHGVREWLDRFQESTADSAARHAVLYVTNFSPHYDGRARPRAGEWLTSRPKCVNQTINADLIAKLEYALDRYGRVPEFSIDGRVLT